MKIDNKNYKTIWFNEKDISVGIIDQTKLPHSLEIVSLKNISDVIHAINIMQVRGAPLIGGAAAYGIFLAMKDNPSDNNLALASKKLIESRPTAVNLKSSVDRMNSELKNITSKERFEASLQLAKTICLEDEECCKLIGLHGKKIIEQFK